MNPLAKFSAASIVGVALLLTLNPLSAVVVLIIDLILLPVAGVSARRLARMLSPLFFMALISAVSTVLYGRSSGEIFWSWGLIHISQGSIALAVTIGLRILAIGIPAVVLAATIDATELADSLTQLWRLPRRFVLGALAAFRLLSLLVDDWHTLEYARRARGLGAGRGPFAAMGRFGGQVFALLVLSVRRGSTLALAMEARGISSPQKPTRARAASWRLRDSAFVVLAIVVAGLALALSAIGSGGLGV
jgi:energy-coupling factor transport system permease protein